MPRNAVLNRRHHRLLRKTIPVTEVLASTTVLVVLAGVVGWVLSTRDGYDRTIREVPDAYLLAERATIRLYNPPLKLWNEPGSETTGGGQGGTLTVAPLPPAIVDATWSLRARVRSFDASNLYEKINGEAEKFIRRGFQAMHYAVLGHASEGSELAIEFYDMGDVAGSLSIFAAHRSRGREVSSNGGVDYFTTGIGLIGRVDKFFFRAASDRESEAVDEKSRQLVTAFSAFASAPQAADATTGPAGLTLLRAVFGVPESAVSFEQENVFQFDFARGFWFATLPDDGGRAFVHFAPSEAEAGSLHAGLLEELGFDYRPRALELEGESGGESEGEGTLEGVLLEHNVLGTHFFMATQGAVVFGVEKSRRAKDAVAAAKRLAGAIRSGAVSEASGPNTVGGRDVR